MSLKPLHVTAPSDPMQVFYYSRYLLIYDDNKITNQKCVTNVLSIETWVCWFSYLFLHIDSRAIQFLFV